jgi:long-chain fatty acid transport protein
MNMKKLNDSPRRVENEPQSVPMASQWFISLTALTTLVPNVAMGLGSRIPNQDPAAIARGNAFAATADNPSALYYNPAGITQLEGHNLQLGSLVYLNIYVDYKSPGGAKTENDTAILPVPQLYYAYSPAESPLSYGFGVYAPFGLGVKWHNDAPFATAGLESKLSYVTLNPVVAYQIGSSLSVAIGPNINYSQAKLRQQATALIPGSSFTFEGDDIGFGFNAGVLWQPHAKWSFGLNYRSASTIDYEGDGTFSPEPPLPAKTDSSAEFKFPQIITGGVSYRPTPDWNLEVNVDWTDWNTLNTVAIKNVGPLPLNWESSFFYEAGVTRFLGKGYFMSAGYFFSEASTPDDNFTPIVPDTDLHIGSFGVGRKGERWDWAMAVQVIGGGYRKVTGNVNPTVDGSYKIFTPTISGSISYRF